MIALQLFALALLATAQARSIDLQDLKIRPYRIDIANLAQDDFEDFLSEQPFESVHPAYLNRVRRQLGTGSMSTNPDGSINLNVKVPIAEGESNVLSAVGSISGIKSVDDFGVKGIKPGYSAAGGGLALDNINGHGLSLTTQHLLGLGNQVTAAGRLGLLDIPDHKVNANAFVSRTMPNIPDLHNFNTYGGSLDYTYKDKIGGSLGIAHTDLLQKTDYSAMGNLNLFRNPTSSFDLNAGFTKSQSPFSDYNHNWQPQVGFGFTKYF